MRIGIDCRTLTGRFTGDRTYWKNLLYALTRLPGNHTFLVYTRSPIQATELPQHGGIVQRVVPSPSDRLWTLFALPLAAARDRVDLLHVQYTVPPESLCSFPVVTTIHDISYRLYPEWYGVKNRLLLNFTTRLATRSAARIITVSESSRRDILRCYNIAPDRVVATPLGLPAPFDHIATVLWTESNRTQARSEAQRMIRDTYGVETPFFLTVGVLQPRKNHVMLARAWGMATRNGLNGYRLVVAGKEGWGAGSDALKAAAAEIGGGTAAETLMTPGYVADEHLPALYRACDVYLHPALYEGFGLPPLEAMASGVPTVVSDRPALPEVVGDAGLIVPATDTNAWADTITRLAKEPQLRDDLASRGPNRASSFTWSRTAEQTMSVYESVVGSQFRSASAGARTPNETPRGKSTGI